MSENNETFSIPHATEFDDGDVLAFHASQSDNLSSLEEARELRALADAREAAAPRQEFIDRVSAAGVRIAARGGLRDAMLNENLFAESIDWSSTDRAA